MQCYVIVLNTQCRTLHFGSTICMEWSDHASGTCSSSVCKYGQVKESVAMAVAGWSVCSTFPVVQHYVVGLHGFRSLISFIDWS